MKYKIELHVNGTCIDRFVVKAVERGVVGNYHNGKPYGPDTEQVYKGLPYAYRKAFERSSGFWCTNLSDVQRCDMNRKKDHAAMGSIFATFIPEPLVVPKGV